MTAGTQHTRGGLITHVCNMVVAPSQGQVKITKYRPLLSNTHSSQHKSGYRAYQKYHCQLETPLAGLLIGFSAD